MTGSDSEEAGHVSRAELATFKHGMANEVVQLQAALHRTVDDIVDTTRSPALGGGGGSNSGPGLQPGSPAPRAPLPGHGAPSIALLGQPFDGGPVGAGTVESPVPGATPPTSGTTGQPVVGVGDAYAGQPGLPYPGQQADGVVVGPAGGYGYGCLLYTSDAADE